MPRKTIAGLEKQNSGMRIIIKRLREIIRQERADYVALFAQTGVDIDEYASQVDKLKVENDLLKKRLKSYSGESIRFAEEANERAKFLVFLETELGVVEFKKFHDEFKGEGKPTYEPEVKINFGGQTYKQQLDEILEAMKEAERCVPNERSA